MSSRNDAVATSTRKPTTYFDAISRAQAEEMARDKTVILIGEDQALYAAGGMFGDVEPGLAALAATYLLSGTLMRYLGAGAQCGAGSTVPPAKSA